jgi:SAM-dependent methyltransferase
MSSRIWREFSKRSCPHAKSSPSPRPSPRKRGEGENCISVEREEYEKLDQVEDRMWWFAALHGNLLTLASRLRLEIVDRPILDAGCGTGGLLRQLARRYPKAVLLGLDCDPLACARAAAKSARSVCAGSVNEMPFADAALAAIFSADVLCHDGVSERDALRQFHRCLVENGWLILNLPAYRWMLSRHDAAVANTRRYTASGLRRLLHSAGFRLVFVSYWNALLFPLMVITRKLLPDNPAMPSDVKLYPRAVDLLCRAATRIELELLRSGLKFPFGSSIIAVAVRSEVANG